MLRGGAQVTVLIILQNRVLWPRQEGPQQCDMYGRGSCKSSEAYEHSVVCRTLVKEHRVCKGFETACGLRYVKSCAPIACERVSDYGTTPTAQENRAIRNFLFIVGVLRRSCACSTCVLSSNACVCQLRKAVSGVAALLWAKLPMPHEEGLPWLVDVAFALVEVIAPFGSQLCGMGCWAWYGWGRWRRRVWERDVVGVAQGEPRLGGSLMCRKGA